MAKDALGKRLKARRIEAGLSLRSLEKIVGVSFSNLARIERGVGTPLPAVSERVEKWVSTGEGSERLQRGHGQSWMLTIENRLTKIEAVLGITEREDDR